jgi:hypothetical protein
MVRDVESGERAADIPATEFVTLHDPAGAKMLVIFFFDSESATQGDAALNAVPPGCLKSMPV